MSQRDPLKELQAAVRAAAEHLTPGHSPYDIIVREKGGSQLFRTIVPPCACGPLASQTPGWVITDRGATFDGTPVAVAVSRLKLLKALVEAKAPLTAKDLTAQVYDRETDIANTRYHLRELKKELDAAFTLGHDVIQGDDEGYRIVLK